MAGALPNKYLLSDTSARKLAKLIGEDDAPAGAPGGDGGPLQVSLIECEDFAFNPPPPAKGYVYGGTIWRLRALDWKWEKFAGGAWLTEANGSRLDPGTMYVAIRSGNYTYTSGTPIDRPVFVAAFPLVDDSSSGGSKSGNSVCVVEDADCSSGGLYVQRRQLSGYVEIGGIRFPLHLELGEDCDPEGGSGS